MIPIEHKAMHFAIKAHGKQMYGNMPYVYHLSKTVGCALFHQLGSLVVTCCWLHDVLEDTNVTKQALEDAFGKEVADIVWAVSGFGETRDDRNKDAWAKTKGNYHAVLVKLCDRMANMGHCVEGMLDEKRTKEVLRLAKMYVDEYPVFMEAIGAARHDSPVIQSLRQYLDYSYAVLSRMVTNVSSSEQLKIK